jgi:hypothetical protein
MELARQGCWHGPMRACALLHGRECGAFWVYISLALNNEHGLALATPGSDLEHIRASDSKPNPAEGSSSRRDGR